MQVIVLPYLLNLSKLVQDGIGVQQTEAFSKVVSDPGILSGSQCKSPATTAEKWLLARTNLHPHLPLFTSSMKKLVQMCR